MDQKILQAAKELLLAQRVRLEDLSARTAKHLYRREEPYSADFSEQAIETQNNEVVEQLDRESQIELQLINKALLRVEQGSYGSCTECGHAINAERLKVIPTAELCMNCAN